MLRKSLRSSVGQSVVISLLAFRLFWHPPRGQLEGTETHLLLYNYTELICLATTDEFCPQCIKTVNQHYALVIVFPEGGTPGCRWENWGLCGDFAAYLCPCGGGNKGPLIYQSPDYGEIWGLCLGTSFHCTILSQPALGNVHCQCFGIKYKNIFYFLPNYK